MATNTANTSPPARRTHMNVVHYLRANIAFGTATSQTLGTLPAGSQILQPISGVMVSTVFNAGTTNTLDVGTSATANLYGTDMALGTKAFVALDEAATATNVNTFYVAVDTVITCLVKMTGTTATTGAGVVVIAYIPPTGPVG
jgi:hypothetical protein